MSTGAGTASGLEKAPFPAKEGAVSDSEAGGGTQRGDVARGRVDHFRIYCGGKQGVCEFLAVFFQTRLVCVKIAGYRQRVIPQRRIIILINIGTGNGLSSVMPIGPPAVTVGKVPGEIKNKILGFPGLKYLLHGDRADRAFFSRGIDPRNRLPSADSFPQAAVFHQILPILLRAIPPAFVKPARLCGKAFLFVCQQSHRAES